MYQIGTRRLLSDMTGHADDSRKPSFWSFFTTLPGILGGLAGLLTAVGAVAALFIASESPSSANPADSSRPPARTPPPSSTRTGADADSASASGSGATASGGTSPGAAGSRGGTASAAGPSRGRGSSGGRGTGSTGDSNTTPKNAGFRVIETSVRADPFRGSVSCPVEIRFSGRISVAGGGGTVTYRWIRSDGASAPVQTLSFEGPDSKDIETTWTRSGDPAAAIAGWQAIEIIEPRASNSRRAPFDLVCG